MQRQRDLAPAASGSATELSRNLGDPSVAQPYIDDDVLAGAGNSRLQMQSKGDEAAWSMPETYLATGEHRLPCDWYHEPDDVVRGATLNNLRPDLGEDYYNDAGSHHKLFPDMFGVQDEDGSSMMGLPGDPYGQRDDAVRGVSLCSFQEDLTSAYLDQMKPSSVFPLGQVDLPDFADHIGMMPPILSPMHSADSCMMPAKVSMDPNQGAGMMPGMLLDSMDLPTFPAGDPWSGAFLDHLPREHLGQSDGRADQDLSDSQLPDPETLQYDQSHPAPVAPSDDDMLERLDPATTFVLPDCPPHAAGNRLLDHFSSQAGFQILKVSPHKHTMKAAACVDGGLSCELKVRIYQMRPTADACPVLGAVIEFQRRRGDAVAFIKIFNDARAQLDAPEKFQRLLCEELPSVLPMPKQTTVEPCLGPLLDMANHVGNSDMQAEVVSSLQTAVQEDARLAPRLCEPQVCLALEQLLLATPFCVLYPTACLLVALAQCPEAARLFPDQGLPRLVEIIFEKLQERATGRAVKEKLALSLQHLIGQAHETMSGDAATKLCAALDGVVRHPVMESDVHHSTRTILQNTVSSVKVRFSQAISASA